MHSRDRKPQSHLIDILKSTQDHHPNFLLFLGAGASATSGVRLTKDMIAEWRSKYHKTYGGCADFEDFLSKEPWYKSNEEYSILFEELYDQPSQRREFIESCVKDASPSWGYIYLVNLLSHSVFNTVFTTNFDDLLNEACYQFSHNVRPIVCAHDSSIRSVRITSKRPKIVKLHGDFLFDNIKNTVTELETLEDNMKEKFKQYASEYGLIILGYSGNDRSIMDTLNLLLKSEANFPHGVYWLVRKTATLNRSVEMLTRYPKVKIIEIDGFDEFFSEVHHSLDLNLQPEMSDPYGSLVKRLNSLIESVKLPKPGDTPSVIERDIKLIGARIAQFSKERSMAVINSDQVPDGELKIGLDSSLIKFPIPFEMLSQLQERSGDFEHAMKYMMRELEVRPNMKKFVKAFALMRRGQLFNVTEVLMNQLRAAKEVVAEEPMDTFDVALELIKCRLFNEAEEVLDMGYEAANRANDPENFNLAYYRINKLQVKAHQAKPFEADEIAKLNELAQSPNKLVLV